jgi:hypothetical protein
MRISGAAFLSLALALGFARLGAEPLSYRVESLPKDALVGESARIVLVVTGLSASGLEVSDPALDEGLALEAWTIRPRIAAGDPGARASELMLDLRVLSAGRHRVGEMRVEGKEGSLRIGPIAFSARDPGQGQSPPSWYWSAPQSPRRCEAFEIKLEPREGIAVPSDATASFLPPAGLAVEPSGILSWTAIAVEEEVALPAVVILSGVKEIGRAPPLTLRPQPLPASVEASKAVGRFALRLDGPLPPALEAGRPCRFALVLSGRGNQPALSLPEPRATVAGEALPASALGLRRVDDARPAGGAFEGSVTLEIILTPPRQGRLELSFDPLPILLPEGRETSLGVPPFRGEVAAASSPNRGPREQGRSGYFDAAMAEAAGSLASVDPALAGLKETLAAASAEGGADARRRDYRRVLGIVENLSGARRHDRRALLLEAGLRWELGERGRSLALLYGLLRREPDSAGLSALAAACSGELGCASPLLDSLPSPTIFEAAGAAALLASATLFFASRRGRRRLLLSVLAACALALGLAAGGLAVAAAKERGQSYAVIWTDRLLSVPSPLAEKALPLVRGSTAKVRGRSSGFVGLVLGQGVAGWVREDEVYFY